MPDSLRHFVDAFLALPASRQVVLLGTALGSLAFFAWIASGARSADYRLLYRGLEDAELVQVVDALTSERIDYRLAEGGNSVEVPRAQVHEARMRIASRGLPSGSSPGFELFDRGSFGVTDFVQKVNYHRAIQGELARTIEQVEGVEKARVQLAVPERKSLLRKHATQPSASVVARLRAGFDLEAEQVRGIVHLVASSVEGLDPDRVTLVDNRGRLLAPQPAVTGGGGASGPGLGTERRVEAELEQQIQSMLERTVGLGRVVAKVNASLDWTRTEKTEELFDPDSQVARSTQTDSESASDRSIEGGVAGVVANSPDTAPDADAGSVAGRSSRSSETVNYEISKVVARHVMPTGRIERLSIAVLVDGKPAGMASEAGESEAADGEAADALAFRPWDEEELAEFEELAKRAVGFDARRGDEIKVLNAPFISLDPAEEGGGIWTPDLVSLLNTVLQGVALLIGLLLFSRLFVRPLADAVRSGETGAVESLREEVMTRLEAVKLATAELEPGQAGGLRAADLEIPGLVEENDEMGLPEQVDRLAQLRTDDSVRTIRGWMAS